MTDPTTNTERKRGLVPIVPVFRPGSLSVRSSLGPPSLLHAKEQILTTSGRAAIALALEALGVGADDEVLVPAYHCLAMTGPILALRAKPVFYRLNEDLTIDLEIVAKLSTPRTRCVLAVHFFGFPQPLDALRAWCDSSGVALIEDCAHTLYGSSPEGPVGCTGDFAIGSLMKFLPVFDGGCLVSFRRKLRSKPMVVSGLRVQVKTAFDIVERSAQWSSSLAARALRGSLNVLRAVAKNTAPTMAEELTQSASSAATGGLQFDREWANVAMSKASRAVLHLSDHDRNVSRRRALFRRYLEAFGSIEGGRPFVRELPDGVTPYVFPFVLARPEVSFDALWRAGVPMYRWEDVAVNYCDTARRYRHTLVQFPCHQELSDRQIDWLIATIIDVLKDTEKLINAP